MQYSSSRSTCPEKAVLFFTYSTKIKNFHPVKSLYTVSAWVSEKIKNSKKNRYFATCKPAIGNGKSYFVLCLDLH